MKLETPVFTAEAALKAAEFGVDRIELCSSFQEGGETPGAGMLSFLKSRINTPIFVMIRPRGGDFVFSEVEISVMEKEIEILDRLGADGFVFGILKENGGVNEKACRKLIRKAGEKPCTFHRAVDVCRDPLEAVGVIADCGFKRILTSGGEEGVEKGLNTIMKMLELAGNDVIIMPGGGMEPRFIEPLNSSGKLKEVHASCKEWEKVSFSNSRMYQETQVLRRLTISRKKVADFKKIL